MKRKLILALSALILISAAACKKNEQPKTASDNIALNAQQEELPDAAVLPNAKIICYVDLINGSNYSVKCSSQFSDNNVDYLDDGIDIKNIDFDGEVISVNITDESILRKIYENNNPEPCSIADIVYGSILGITFSEDGKSLTDVVVLDNKAK